MEILNNEDSFGGVESLQETIAPFLGGDAVITARMIKEVHPRADGPATKASHDVRRLEIVNEGSMVDHAKTRNETGNACHEPSATVNSWLSSGSNQVHPGGGETARGTFAIDMDAYANPNSNLSAIALTRA